MTERLTPKEFNIPRENPVANLVFEGIQDYEVLNAASLKEGEQKFAAALIKVLENMEVEERPLGMGSQSLVQRLKEAKGLVIKRLMFGKKLRGQGSLSPDQYFEYKKSEYELVKKYFGSDFTPQSEFVIVDTNFASPHPDTIPGHEYIMVQEELSGEDVSFQLRAEHNFDSSRISPELREKLVEFVKRYEQMQKASKTVIEDQIRVDFKKGQLFIQDTDFLPSYSNFTESNAFLETISQSGIDLSDVHSLVKLLGEAVPGFAELRNISDEHLSEALPLTETTEFADATSWLLRKLDEEGKTAEEKQKIVGDFGKLVTAIDYFPPTGDNVFIKRFKKAFHLFQE